MSALYGCSRSVLFGLAALAFVFGVTSLATVGPGEGEPVGPGGGEPPGALEPRFAATAEVFVDPASGHRMRVFVDPRTGDRRYVAED
jgi:hypothetical protein